MLEPGEEDYSSDYSDFDDYYYDDDRRAHRRKKKKPQFSLPAAAEASNGQRVSAVVLPKYDYALVLTCDRSCMLAAVTSASWQKHGHQCTELRLEGKVPVVLRSCRHAIHGATHLRNDDGKPTGTRVRDELAV